MSDQGLIGHVVDNLTGGVVGAGLLAGTFLGFGVVGSEQVFKHLAEQLGV